jgi:hypothetical protein
MACSTHGAEDECVFNINGKSRRKETIRKARRRREDDIKMNLREIGWGGMD